MRRFPDDRHPVHQASDWRRVRARHDPVDPRHDVADRPRPGRRRRLPHRLRRRLQQSPIGDDRRALRPARRERPHPRRAGGTRRLPATRRSQAQLQRRQGAGLLARQTGLRFLRTLSRSFRFKLQQIRQGQMCVTLPVYHK